LNVLKSNYDIDLNHPIYSESQVLSRLRRVFEVEDGDGNTGEDYIGKDETYL